MQALEDSITAALSADPTLRHLQSVLVARDGQLQLEQYFRDRRPTDLGNVHSVTKSVLATLAGIAIEQGALTLETREGNLTVEQLLTMTAGLEADTPHDIDDIADSGESWVAGPLAAPPRADPGTAFVYNSHSAGGPPENVPYGYLWWISEDAGHPSFFAGGYGGQYVTVVPELALVVVTTGDVAVLTPTSGNPRQLVADVIIPALSA